MAEEQDKSNKEKVDEYQAELQERLKTGTHVPDSHFGKLLIGLAVSGGVAIGSLMGANYAMHSGPQEQKYRREVESNSKPTGMLSYVEYRKITNLWTDDGKRYKRIDVISKGDLFKGVLEYYSDLNQDKKVDVIVAEGVTFRREKDYKKHKPKFDTADEYFAEYFEELSK